MLFDFFVFKWLKITFITLAVYSRHIGLLGKIILSLRLFKGFTPTIMPLCQYPGISTCSKLQLTEYKRLSRMCWWCRKLKGYHVHA